MNLKPCASPKICINFCSRSLKNDLNIFNCWLYLKTFYDTRAYRKSKSKGHYQGIKRKIVFKKTQQIDEKESRSKKSTSQISMIWRTINKIKIDSLPDLKTCKEYKQLQIFYWVILLQTFYLRSLKIRMLIMLVHG